MKDWLLAADVENDSESVVASREAVQRIIEEIEGFSVLHHVNWWML